MNGNESINHPLHNENLMLRKLLSSWNLDGLSQHFIDEGISVDVLTMLKPHHIQMLLRNFSLGIQIRFEYHLERWRHQIDKPLRSHSSSQVPCYCCQHDIGRRGLRPDVLQPMHNVSTQWPYPASTDLHKSCPPHLVSVSPTVSPALSHDSHETRQPPNLTPAPPVPTAAPQAKKPPTLTPSTLSGTPVTTSPTAPNQRPQKNLVFSGDDYRTPHVSVSLILSVSQPKGQQLLDYYREHHSLTNAHRLQLINLIATYFDDNDYHLSLQTSYNMEREILKLFPNERLESYRTEKRGKIYVKFCNMKRYKAMRERPSKIRRLGSLDSSAGMAAAAAAAEDAISAADEDFTMGFETWDQPNTGADVYVKTENDYL